MAQFLDLDGLKTFLAGIKNWVTEQINSAKSTLQSSINNKADKSHTHSNLTITLNGGTTEGTDKIVYTGGAAKTLNITASEVGAAASSHTHSISNITNLQTTLDGKAASSHTHSASQVTGLTASRALVSDSSGHPAVSAVTSTELGYLDGVTSSIQTQLNGKAASSHTHAISALSDLNSGWDSYLKIAPKLINSATALTNQNLEDYKTTDHVGFYYGAGGNSVTNKPSGVDAFSLTIVRSGSGVVTQILTSSNTVYIRYYSTTSDWTAWEKLADSADLAGKANSSHTHTISQVTNLQSTLDGKAASSHTHTASQVNGLAKVATSGSYNDLSNKPSIPAAYSLPTASSTTKGGITLGYSENGKNYPLELDSSGKAFVNVPWTDNNTTYSAGTGLSLSGSTFSVKTGYTTSGKNYKVAADSSGNLYVNVPWTDNNTTYSTFKAATASAAGGSGLVPAPAAGENDEYLRGDGTWATPTNTTYSNATTSTAGLMSASDKSKLDGIASGANNYTHPTSSGNKHIPAGGSSGQILRWASDGTAQWGSDNNTTYSAFKGATSSAAGGSGLVPAPAAGSQTKYLRADGTWQTPPDTNTTYGVATTSSNGLMSKDDKTKLDGIASGANKYTHPSYTAKTSGLYKITVDSTGHVSAVANVGKGDITALGIPGSDTNTHYTTKLYAGTSTGSANASTSNGATHLILMDDSTVRNRVKLTGSGATSVSSDASGNITISSTNTTYGAATTSASGLMTAAMVTKLNGITSSADSVSFSRSLTSGTKIGTITINGTGTTIYGPATDTAISTEDIEAAFNEVF